MLRQAKATPTPRVELSAGLNNDATYATNVANALNAKAPLLSPSLSGTATAVGLTVSGDLINGTSNVLTSLNSKASTIDVGLEAPLLSPTLTGTATAVGLPVSDNLLIGTTNVWTSYD
jgi:hypothetical protein